MPLWLSIILAVVSWLCALQQLRMYFTYTGRMHSSTIGSIEGGPTLRAVALRSAITFTIYGFLVLLVPWPRLLTYVSIVWLCRATIDAALVWFGKGDQSSTSAIMTDKGRRHCIISESVAVLCRAVVVVVCAYFFGF